MDAGMINVLAPIVGLGVVSISVGWVITTWLRIKHGYPLDGAWGQAVYPSSDKEAKHRVTLLTQENAELRAEVGSLKDRLANVERIVTDRGYHLGAEIDALRDKALAGLTDKGAA